MPPWLVVAGDFTPLGGMDRANLALASYLALRAGAETHLVAHRVLGGLREVANVHIRHVPRPGGKHALGAPLLDREGRRQARRLAPLGRGSWSTAATAASARDA